MHAHGDLSLKSEIADRKYLRKFRGYYGELQPEKLTPVARDKLRGTLAHQPSAFIATAGADNVVGAVMDTGATFPASNQRKLFKPGSLHELAVHQTMSGIAGGIEIKYEGIMCFETLSDEGNIETVECTGYYIPELPVTLLCPRAIAHYQWQLDTSQEGWDFRASCRRHGHDLLFTNSNFLPSSSAFDPAGRQL